LRDCWYRRKYLRLYSKATYDAIIALQPHKIFTYTNQRRHQKTLNYKDAPADVQRQIEERAGLSSIWFSITCHHRLQGLFAAEKRQNPNVVGISSDPNSSRTKTANQLPRPQAPMGAAVDASLGQAANLPFFQVDL